MLRDALVLVLLAAACGRGPSPGSPASSTTVPGGSAATAVPALLATVGPAPRVYAAVSFGDALAHEFLVGVEEAARDELGKSLGECGLAVANLQRLRVAVGEPLRIAAELDGAVDARAIGCLLGDRGAAALAGAGVTVRDRPGGVAIEYATQPLNERAAVSARELVRRCEATSCAVAMLGPPSARLWLQLVLDKTLRGQLTGASFHRFAEAAGALFEDLRRTSPSMALPTIREQAGGLSISAAPGDSVEASTKLAMILRARLVEAFRVPSSSMVPTLQANDQIFVGKGQLLGDVAPGDLVAYKQEGRIYIKRYLAGPGQTVTETDAGLSVDGKPLAIEVVDRAYHYRDQDEVEGAVDRSGALVREHLGSRSYLTVRTGPPHSKDTWKVPPDHVFFIGDNRNNSNDSRYLGASPKDAIVGRVLCTWFALRDRLPDWDRIGIALE